jgi:protein-S-isoprenylcysteine O-methyltransferase Ste14
MLTFVIAHLTVYGGLLFAAAGTLWWPAGWAFLGLYAIQLLVNDVWVARRDPDLAKERRMPGRATAPPKWDRRYMVATAIFAPAWMIFMALDAKRFGWSHLPSAAALAGGALMLVGIILIYASLRANRYASTVVRIQEDRGQQVINTGPYAHVRHPMYAGTMLNALGMPFVLGSAWGLVGAGLLIGLIACRTMLEDRYLRNELAGYEVYAERVRWRLIPGLF